MGLSIRLSLFYAAVFSVIGVQLPFWPLYLSSKGLDAAQIGLALAAAYAVKMITNPLIGQVVDRSGERRRPLIILSAAGLAALGLFAVVDGFPLVLVVTMLSQATITALIPLGDSLTLQSVVTHRLDYGRIRLWGSLAFIAVSTSCGWLLVDAPRPLILAAACLGQALTLAVAWRMPDIRAPQPVRQTPPPLSRLFRGGRFPLFLAVSSLTQVSHMIYYGFATLHWRAAGLSGGMIGGLWAEGVIAEVALFACGARLLKRFGPVTLMASAGAGGIVRWIVLGCTTDPALLAGVQFLHALTFAANHLGAMHFINRTTPPGLSARAQGLYSSVTNGLVPGIAMLGAGWLYQSLGGRSFLVMAVASAGGLALASVLRRRMPATPRTA